LFFHNKLWSKSTNSNTRSNNIRKSESDCYRGSDTRRTWSRMSRTTSSTIRTGFNWLILGRPGTGFVYLRRYQSITPVAIVFASGHLSICNGCVKIFGLTLMRLIACYLSAVRCLTYTYCVIVWPRLSDYVVICVLVVGCYTGCSL